MLVKNLEELQKVDTQITSLLETLSGLYEQRAKLIAPNKLTDNSSISSQFVASKTKNEKLREVKSRYAEISIAWDRYGIKTPAFDTIKDKLINAQEIIESFSPVKELTNKMIILAVPPTRLLSFPVSGEIRAKKEYTQYEDAVSLDLALKLKTHKGWRVLVVYGSEAGLSFEVVNNTSHPISLALSGYDCSALGVAEYAALSLQIERPIDTTSWTCLPKKTQMTAKDNQYATVAYAGLRNGRYRFDLNDMYGIFDDDRFRPAIEIK